MTTQTLSIPGYSSLDVRQRAVHAVLVNQMSIADVAQAHGVDRATLYRWLQRFQESGGSGLQRRPVSGRPRKLAMLDSETLIELVLAPASQHGYETDFWTTRRLVQVIDRLFHVQLSKWTVWRRLQDAGLSYQKPDREYFELSQAERSAWRRTELPKIRRTVRKHKAILYFQDEANVSLTALLGKTWSPVGVTPKQRVTGKRGGVSAISAIAARGQLVFRLHEKRIASDQVIEFLGQLLQHHPRRHVVVVMDQAPPHTSEKTKAYIASQRRLHVFWLPKYSPDWNPDEKVWSHLKNQELKGHQARTKDELQDLAEKKLQAMSQDPELIQGLFFRCCMADVLAM